MGLEAAALYGAFTMYNDYDMYSTEYNDANAAYMAATEDLDILDKFAIKKNILKKKNNSLIGLGGMGVSSVVIWIWNINDAGKSIPTDFDLSSTTNIQIGVNKRGHLEAKLVF